MPVDGGSPEPLFRDPTRLPPNFGVRLVSGDGRWVLGTTLDPRVPGMQLALVPVDQSQPVRTFPFPFQMPPNFGFAWAPAADAFDVLVLRDGVRNLWRFPLDGRAPAQVTTFAPASENPINFAWSRDGKTLAMSRTTQSSDVVLITNPE